MKKRLGGICDESKSHSVGDATYTEYYEMVEDVTLKSFIDSILKGEGLGKWGSIYVISNKKYEKKCDYSYGEASIEIENKLNLKIEKFEVNYGWGYANYDLILKE